jgi:hypothetical protein
MEEILTAKEIAAELRCSTAQIYRAINGEVKGCTKLSAIHLGRKKLVRRSTFEKWKQENESMGWTGQPS